MRTMTLVAAALFGASVGSFLNVVIYRVPRGESVVRPPSRCPSCGTTLSALDNVPLLSWIALRGRCRTCKAPIGARYPAVEALTMLFWIASALRFPSIEQAAFVALSGSSLIALTFIDIEHRRLPNAIVLPTTAAAVVWVAVTAGVAGDWGILVSALLCGAAAFSVLFVIAIVSRGMGFGDVKLAALLGVVTGRFDWHVTFAGMLLGFFIGGFYALILLAVRRRGRKDVLPFGPSLIVGAIAAIFLGAERIVRVLGY